MTMTIRPVSTIEFIGLSETNTIGYYDALAVSYNATAADRKYIAYANLGRDDRYLAACGHNFHQLMTAATYLGQYEAALSAANAVQRLLTADMLRTDIPQLARTLEAHYAMKSHVLVRFGKWKEIIEEPLPEDAQLYCVTTAMMRYAHGVAYAALGQHDAADIERAQFSAARENVPADRLIMNNQAHAILGVATEMLNGEVAYLAATTPSPFTTCARRSSMTTRSTTRSHGRGCTRLGMRWARCSSRRGMWTKRNRSIAPTWASMGY
jgi:hypothetical protein